MGSFCHKGHTGASAHKQPQLVATKAGKKVERLEKQIAKAKAHNTASEKHVAIAAQEVLAARQAYGRAYPSRGGQAAGVMKKLLGHPSRGRGDAAPAHR